MENDKNEEADFTQETMTFTVQMIKIWTIKWTFKNIKAIDFALVVNTDLLQKHLWWYNF